MKKLKSKSKNDFQKRFGISAIAVRSRLQRILIRQLLKELGRFKCYRCKLSLNNDDYTIDHKIPWAYATNGLELFLDYKNIAFSHFSCNAKHARTN
ncbi:MAG: HNH endonuclease signature motif containing protein, partial [Thermodesulfobacteriota bacterium]